MLTVNLNGFVVKRSKNLRGMRDYARTSSVVKIETRMRNGWANDPGGVLLVTYANGATSESEFASYHIMIDFVRNRRSWLGAEVIHANEDMGYLTVPGIIVGVR